MAEKFEQLDKKVDRKLTAAEMYLNRPRKWWIYTLIVLILVVLVGWSGSSIHFEGLTVTGREVAKGVISGVTHPDLKLMFGTGDTDVPYLLLQTMAIAVLGTLIGAILAIPFAFLASTNIMPKPIAYLFRVIILLIRTIPSLVWALMWIRVTGPGASCGVITQSVCSIGMTTFLRASTPWAATRSRRSATVSSPSSPRASFQRPSTASTSTSKMPRRSVLSAPAESVPLWCSA